jgi:hypothetical protein
LADGERHQIDALLAEKVLSVVGWERFDSKTSPSAREAAKPKLVATAA